MPTPDRRTLRSASSALSPHAGAAARMGVPSVSATATAATTGAAAAAATACTERRG